MDTNVGKGIGRKEAQEAQKGMGNVGNMGNVAQIFLRLLRLFAANGFLVIVVRGLD